jgi:hypothetical protein
MSEQLEIVFFDDEEKTPEARTSSESLVTPSAECVSADVGEKE